MNCPNCGFENPEGHKFCGNCGAALDAVPPDEERLARLREAVPQALAEKALKAGSKEGERRPVTVLFADVVGSTALAEKRDPEEAKIILEEALSLVMAQVSRYEGLVADLLGDGLLAFFGAPIAHEDDPERATRAALDIQEALSAYGEEIKAAYGVPLQVRVGINTGPVVVGEMGSDLKMEYTAMGDAVNLASRMESQAPPGGILITEATHRLTERLFTFEPQGKLQVKGREEPVEAYLVTGLVQEPVRVRGIEGLRSPMVGRDQEQAQLMEAVENLVSGKGQIVTVMGEAGIGKTRLIQETREASRDHDILWLEGRALSYGQSLSLFLFQDVIRNYLGVSEGESPSLIRVKLKSKTRALFGDREAEIYPYLASLLSIKLEGEMQERIADLHPEALKRRIFVVVGELLERVAQDQPVAVILEDLHWADPTSIELLKGLLPSTDRAPIMVTGIFRPETERPSWEIRELASREFRHRYLEMSLTPLPEEESGTLVGNLLAVAEFPEGIKKTVLARTQGNPFFLEEVVRGLIEEGVLVKQQDRWRATSKILAVQIPDTVQGVIRARIDRLDEKPRQLLQVAAVIGQSFLYPVLVNVAQIDGKLDEHLSSLQKLELIEERARLPELEYAFKHVLTQEVAYQGLLTATRREFHRRAAKSLETLFPDRLEEFFGTLGHHWSEAGDSKRAVEYLNQAGDRARLAYAAQEAEKHYKRALEHLREAGDDEGVAKTLMKLGLVHHISGSYQKVAANYEEAFAIWDPTDSQVPDEAGRETLKLITESVFTLSPERYFWATEAAILDQLFEGLAREDSEGNVVPGVAKSWEISEEGARYVFHLRPGLVWSDGGPVTAHDFEYSWKRLLDPTTGSTYATLFYPIRGARSFHGGETADPAGVGVRSLDDLTLEVTLEAPTPYFLYLVADWHPLPRWAIEGHGDRWWEPGKMVSNGPFVLADFTPGESVALERNSSYAGRFRGNLARVEWTIPTARSDYLPLYEADNLHVSSVGPGELERARTVHSSELHATPALNTQYLAFVVDQPPFDDPRIRRAFVQAADRQKLAAIGSDIAARGGVVPPGMAGHSAEVGVDYDPETARELLAQAGYPDGRNFPLVLTLSGIYPSEVATDLAVQWKDQLGVDVRLHVVDAEDFREDLNRAPPHMYLIGWVADYPDPHNFLDTIFRSSSMFNRTGWRSDQFDELLDQGSRLTDQTRRMASYERADAILVSRDVVVMPLLYGRANMLVKPWVKGYKLSLRGRADLRQVTIERP